MPTLPSRQLRITVSGSFKRHLAGIRDAVEACAAGGHVVVSPADPRVVDSFGDFLFVASDLRRSIKGVQNRHFEAIRISDFLWLVCPDGYVGTSAAMEIGFAVASGVPVYSDAPPAEIEVRLLVTPVGSIAEACQLARDRQPAVAGAEAGLLVAPEATLEAVRQELEGVEHGLLRDRAQKAHDPIEASLRRVGTLLRVPGQR